MSDVNAEEMSERLSDPMTGENSPGGKPGNKNPDTKGYGTGGDSEGKMEDAVAQRDHLGREN